MSQSLIDQTYYEVLEIDASATEQEVIVAYQKAKQTYSTDSPALYTMFTPEEAKELARLIEEAYAVLSNSTARKEYDRRLNGGSKDEPLAPKGRNTNKAVPKGHKKTFLSTYPANPEMEEEILNCESFDGPMLKRIREYKNVDIPSLSEETRVSKTYIKAIEANEYEVLPADVFVRGFVVQYAKILNIDHDKVAKSYMKHLKNARL